MARAKPKAKRGNSEGSIYQVQDGTWRAAIPIGRDPNTGKIKRKYLRASTRQEAHQRLTEAQGHVISRTMVEPGSMTVAAWLDLYWREYCWPNKAPMKADHDEKVFRLHGKPKLGHLRLQQIRREHIQRWYNRLIADGLKEDTAHKYMLSLSAAFRQAVDNELIQKNPCSGLVRAVQQEHEYDFLSIAEARRFLESLGDDPWAPVWAVALYAGLRRGEIIGLRWQDVELDLGQIHVQQQIQYLWIDAEGHRTQSHQATLPPKSEAGNRIIPIAGEVITLLRRQKARQAEERLLYGHLYDESRGDLVFCREGGKPLPTTGLADNLKRQLKAAGLPPLRVHDLRHTYACVLESLGIPITAIRYLLGHSDVRTTERYLHALHKRAPASEQLVQQREAARRLAQALNAGVGGSNDGSNAAATQANPAS
jgi:integrase